MATATIDGLFEPSLKETVVSDEFLGRIIGSGEENLLSALSFRGNNTLRQMRSPFVDRPDFEGAMDLSIRLFSRDGLVDYTNKVYPFLDRYDSQRVIYAIAQLIDISNVKKKKRKDGSLEPNHFLGVAEILVKSHQIAYRQPVLQVSRDTNLTYFSEQCLSSIRDIESQLITGPIGVVDIAGIRININAGDLLTAIKNLSRFVYHTFKEEKARGILRDYNQLRNYVSNQTIDNQTLMQHLTDLKTKIESLNSAEIRVDTLPISLALIIATNGHDLVEDYAPTLAESDYFSGKKSREAAISLLCPDWLYKSKELMKTQERLDIFLDIISQREEGGKKIHSYYKYLERMKAKLEAYMLQGKIKKRDYIDALKIKAADAIHNIVTLDQAASSGRKFEPAEKLERVYKNFVIIDFLTRRINDGYFDPTLIYLRSQLIAYTLWRINKEKEDVKGKLQTDIDNHWIKLWAQRIKTDPSLDPEIRARYDPDLISDKTLKSNFYDQLMIDYSANIKRLTQQTPGGRTKTWPYDGIIEETYDALMKDKASEDRIMGPVNASLDKQYMHLQAFEAAITALWKDEAITKKMYKLNEFRWNSEISSETRSTTF